MSTIPRIDPTYLTMICDVYVELEDILSDGEIGAILIGSGLEDVYPNSNRHNRMLNAFTNQQDRDNNANVLSTFLRRTGEYLDKRKGDDAVNQFREKINLILTYVGFELDENCNFSPVDNSRPMYATKHAEERAENLNRGVKARHLHPDILLSTRPEYMEDRGRGYHRCVLEANNMLREKLKAKAGINIDGPTIAEHAFAFSSQQKPRLIFNEFASEGDYAEQFTLMCMLKALFLMFQDEQTKTYRPHWYISFEDALDMLSLISMFHRKIDVSKRPQ